MTPMLKKALHSWIFNQGYPQMVDGLGLQPDPELAARNQQRVRAAIKTMGRKYCCFNENAPITLIGGDPLFDIDERAAENDSQEQAAHSHTELTSWD